MREEFFFLRPLEIVPNKALSLSLSLSVHAYLGTIGGGGSWRWRYFLHLCRLKKKTQRYQSGCVGQISSVCVARKNKTKKTKKKHKDISQVPWERFLLSVSPKKQKNKQKTRHASGVKTDTSPGLRGEGVGFVVAGAWAGNQM
eukprot:Tamp_28010.p1 GENE.Tamp_28010~~Tamp_28010.p1  ORF type:complete len:143 (-),score=10.44 Tamp_28010:99-527(-)